ncbi:28382_t:CDS:1, partial [Racocetra persica]
ELVYINNITFEEEKSDLSNSIEDKKNDSVMLSLQEFLSDSSF